MIILKLATNGLDLIKLETSLVTSDNKKSVSLDVTFDDSWTGYGKSATFKSSSSDKIYEVPLADNTCVVPWEVLESVGTMSVGVRGVKDDGSVVASDLVDYKIAQGATPGDGTSEDPTHTVYEQLLSNYGSVDQKITKEIQDRKDAISKEIQDRANAIATEKSERMTEVDVERKRIDNIIKLPSGSTSGDAELMDIRVGADGKTYPTAGDAVREQVSSLKEDLDNKIFSKNNTINILPPYSEPGIYSTENGSKQDDNSHIRTPNAIKLPNELVDNKIRWASTVNVTDYIAFLFYRSENTDSFISADSTNSGVTDTIPVPNGAKYLRVWAYKDYDLKNLCITQQARQYVAYKESSYSKNESHLLLNKNIVNFGDSIFGATRPPKDVSSFLQNITGSNVINAGFSGCRMGYHNESIYDAFSMYRLANSICSNDWSLQDNAIASGLLPSDFGITVQILKQIDWTTIDIITIAYGTNDFTDGLQPWQTPEEQAQNQDGFNRYTSDALRYSIEKILSKYPNIRIFILTPCYRFRMTSDGAFLDDSNTWEVKSWTGDYSIHTLLDFVDAEKKVAKEYQLPVIDNYYDLGINKFNRTEYFPSTDGTHHNEKGRELIAKHIAKYLW